MLVSFHLCCLSASRRCSRKLLVLESHQKLKLCLVEQLLQMSKQRPCKIVMCNQTARTANVLENTRVCNCLFSYFKSAEMPQTSVVQSTLSKTDTFGTGTSCLSQRDIRLIESQQREQRKAGTNSKCPFYRGVRLIEVSVKRESTVFIYLFYFHLN